MRHLLPFVAIVSLAASACVTDEDDAFEVTQEVVGTPDELALVRFLNDASTTVAVLDDKVPLEKRAAQNLIAHRDGVDGLPGTPDDDRFDSATEVDDVAYVGPAAMTSLIAFAKAGAWVHDDEVFGTFDDVVFTVAEARAAVVLVNTATEAALRNDVHLDSRAVTSIVAARPVLTMSQLAGLYYVGTAMMTRIKTAAAVPVPPTTCSDDPLLAQLDAAVAGMWLTSESDYPLERVAWAGHGADGSTKAKFLALLGLPSTTPVRVGTFDQMMTRLGYSNEEAAVTALRALLSSKLTNIVVYEVGTIQVHDYIVGVTACGGLVGVTSISIET